MKFAFSVIKKNSIEDYFDSINSLIDIDNQLCADTGWKDSPWNHRAIDDLAMEGFFAVRSSIYSIEYRESIAQVIPYVVFRKDGKYLLFQRKTGDGRLLGATTIGVGGHIEPEDIDIHLKSDTPCIQALMRLCRNNIIREVEEEVPELSPYVQEVLMPTYMIADNTTEVNSVHLGLVFIIDIQDDVRFPLTETDELKPHNTWYSKEELLAMDSTESWSRIFLEGISDATT